LKEYKLNTLKPYIFLVGFVLFFSSVKNYSQHIIISDSLINSDELFSVGFFSGVRFGEYSPEVDAGWTVGADLAVPTGKGWSIKLQNNFWFANGHEDYSKYKEYYYQSGKLTAYNLALKVSYKIEFNDLFIQLSTGPGYVYLSNDRYNSSHPDYISLELSTIFGAEISKNIEAFIECRKQYVTFYYGINYDPWLMGAGFNYKFY